MRKHKTTKAKPAREPFTDGAAATPETMAVDATPRAGDVQGTRTVIAASYPAVIEVETGFFNDKES